MAAPKVSVVIPTYNHLGDLLRPCLASVERHTDLGRCEVVVVANGCADGTEDFVRSLGPWARLVSFPEPLGFTRAANEGIRASAGEHVVLLNNDTVLLDQPRDRWIGMLMEPFLGNHRVGVSGPAKFWWDCAGAPW